MKNSDGKNTITITHFRVYIDYCIIVVLVIIILLFILSLSPVHGQVSSITSSQNTSQESSFGEGGQSIFDVIAQNNQQSSESGENTSGQNTSNLGGTNSLNTQRRQDGFTDIQGHKYEENIRYLQNLGVVQGYPDGSYGPDWGLTRGEMMKIVLLTALGNEPTRYSNCFPDVTTQRYASYICYAKQNGIVNGLPDGTFGPTRQVTFAEGAKIALESFSINITEGVGADWYIPYIDYLHHNKLFSKYAVYPNRPISRGAMAYLVGQLHRYQQGELTLSQPEQSDFGSNQSDDLGTDGGSNGGSDSGSDSLLGRSRNTSTIPRVSSAGCQQQPPSQKPSSIVIDGRQRSYILDVGRNYDSSTPTPLVFAFHGRTNSNRQVQGYYNIDRAAGGDAIIVYPLGLPEGGPSRTWADPGDSPEQLRDLALFDGLVEQLSEQYCVDEQKIFAVGHSLGAWFSNSLACMRGDTLRAIGTVGGSTTVHDTCTGSTAAMIMHNPEDRLASFAGGEVARDQLLRQNRCGQQTRPVGPSRANCVEYTSCAEDAPVIWCPHNDSTAYNGNYYPHTRPDNAGRMFWEFFQDFQ